MDWLWIMHYLRTRNSHCWGYRAMLFQRRIIQGRTSIILVNGRQKKGGKEYNDETHNTTRNPNNKNINNSKKNLRRRSKIPALIHMKPKETAETICSKQLACAMQTRWHLNLQVNQLAKSDAIKLNKLSKTGIASAIIHARIQTANPIATQDPVAIQSRECMRSLLRKIRT